MLYTQSGTSNTWWCSATQEVNVTAARRIRITEFIHGCTSSESSHHILDMACRIHGGVRLLSLREVNVVYLTVAQHIRSTGFIHGGTRTYVRIQTGCMHINRQGAGGI